MKQVFIYSNCIFPHGSASANYLQYLGRALIEIGYDVYLISNGNYDKCQYDQEKKLYEYKGINFKKINEEHPGFKKYIDKIVSIHEFTEFVKCHKPQKDDLIIVYSSDATKLKALLRFARRRNLKIVACVVEWFPKEFYPRNSHKKYQNIFDKIYPKFDLLFPISRYIADYLTSCGGKCAVLPIMTDPYEYNYMEMKRNDVENKRFLFIKNGMMKDCSDVLFDAINSMSFEEFEKLEFHFKGYKEEDIKKVLTSKFWPLLGRKIITHGWMEYDELISLYNNMTFLILPREKNQMTLANFPSKIPEVMCFGMIPIVSDVGDYTDLYLRDNIDSIFIRECNSIGCLEAIRKAADLSYIKIRDMSKQARKTAVDRFNFRVWEDYIGDALKKL